MNREERKRPDAGEPRGGESGREEAFTRLELLVVMAVVGMLFVPLLVALAGARAQTNISVCMDNQRQMALGWRMYAEDNYDTIMDMFDAVGSWRVRPDNMAPPYPAVTSIADAAMKYDEAGFKQGALHPYVQNTKIIHCPADYGINRTVTPRYVSYSGMAALNDLDFTSDLVHPADRFLWVEEDDPRTMMVNGRLIGENLGSWAFQYDPQPSDWPGLTWWDAPAAFHVNSAVFSHADGHVSTRQWVDNATLAIAVYMPAAGQPTKSSLALQISVSSSPTGDPLYSDGLGSRRDLPFMAAGYASSLNP